MLQQPVAVLGQGKVEAVRMERTALQGDGSGQGNRYLLTTRCKPSIGPWVTPRSQSQALRSTPRATLFQTRVDGSSAMDATSTGFMPPAGSRPIGLIGSTKSDAQETISNLVEDAQAGLLEAKGPGTGADGLPHLAGEARRALHDLAWLGAS